jgi:hypothetical protein
MSAPDAYGADVGGGRGWDFRNRRMLGCYRNWDRIRSRPSRTDNKCLWVARSHLSQQISELGPRIAHCECCERLPEKPTTTSSRSGTVKRKIAAFLAGSCKRKSPIANRIPRQAESTRNDGEGSKENERWVHRQEPKTFRWDQDRSDENNHGHRDNREWCSRVDRVLSFPRAKGRAIPARCRQASCGPSRRQPARKLKPRGVAFSRWMTTAAEKARLQRSGG